MIGLELNTVILVWPMRMRESFLPSKGDGNMFLLLKFCFSLLFAGLMFKACCFHLIIWGDKPEDKIQNVEDEKTKLKRPELNNSESALLPSTDRWDIKYLYFFHSQLFFFFSGCLFVFVFVFTVIRNENYLLPHSVFWNCYQ